MWKQTYTDIHTEHTQTDTHVKTDTHIHTLIRMDIHTLICMDTQKHTCTVALKLRAWQC